MSKRLRTDSLCSTAPSIGSKTPAVLVAGSTSPPPKYASLEPEEVAPAPIMECLLPPHKPLKFTTYDAYESHYNKAHTNRCTECRSNFPTSHFMNLHIAENHDPILASKKAAGEKTYACFVEGCEKVCRDWKKRRSHLIDKHGYPKNYEFLVVNYGIDGRRSMLRPGVDSNDHRKNSRERLASESAASESTQATEDTSLDCKNSTAGDGEAESKLVGLESAKQSTDLSATKDCEVVDELTSSMSALRMVPRSITFGKRKGRAGFAKS